MKIRIFGPFLTAAVCLVLLAVGCTEKATEEIVAEDISPYNGIEAYDFSLDTYEGDTHTLSDYKGKVVVLNFWYST